MSVSAENVDEMLQGYNKDFTIGTVCSHSSLQIFYGARQEGFRTYGIAKDREMLKVHDAFPLARPDKFMVVKDYKEMIEKADKLRAEHFVAVPTGSFVEYLGPELFGEFAVPTFGNRRVLEWESDRDKQYDWLKSAGVPVPRRFNPEDEIDVPVVIKPHGAKGGKGLIIADKTDLREKLAEIPPEEKYFIQEYVMGTRYYLQFFWSPLSNNGYKISKGSIQLLGIDRRDEANVDEFYKLGSRKDLEEIGFTPTFVVTGNAPVVLRESLLPQAFDMARKTVEKSIDLFGGMVGPFCLEAIAVDDLKFKVFEISTRIVAGSNLFISGSPYSDMIAPGLSTGRRIAQEIKHALETDRLGEVLS